MDAKLQEALAIIPSLADQLQGQDLLAAGPRVPQPPYPDLPDTAPPLPSYFYSLSPKDGDLWSTALDREWTSFRIWCTSPPCLARPSKPICQQSLKSQMVTLGSFLGYCARALQLGGSKLTLAAALQPQLIACFIRAKMQAGQQQQTVVKVQMHLYKVTQWWAAPAQQLSEAELSRLKQVQAWLGTMGRIILLTIQPKRKDREELEEQGKWLPAGELVRAIEPARRAAIQELSSVVAARRTLTTPFCRHVHDILMAVLLFGYLPPFRVSCLASLTYDGGACALCSVAGCRGNTLTFSQSGEVQGMLLTHHKTLGINTAPLHLRHLPAEVLQLLQPFLKHCRAQLGIRFGPRTLLVRKTGVNMKAEGMSPYFCACVLPALGLGHVRFPPQILRHIFIDERLSGGPQPTPGPAHGDAALMMGNSLKTWEHRYHLNRDQARLDRLGTGMSAWRNNLMAQGASGQ